MFWEAMNPGREIEWGYAQDAIADHMEAVWSGEIRQLVITTPPGTTKSTIACVCFPAWVFAHAPESRILIGSNSIKAADRDSLYCRRVIQSELYQSYYCRDKDGKLVWGLALDQNAKDWYQTTRNGHRQAVTVNGVVTSKKGDILIVDDPNDAAQVHSQAYCKAVHRWFDEGFYSRADNPRTARYVSIGQRTGVNDLQGHLIKKGWLELRITERRERTVFSTPIWKDPRKEEGDWLRPERFSEAEEKDAVKNMGQRAYSAQHQQNPVNREGRMFDRDKARKVSAIPVGTQTVRYWDTAATTNETSCYTSGVKMGRTPEGRYVVADVKRGRWNPPDRNKVMRNTGLSDMYNHAHTGYRMYFEKGAADSGVERDANLIQFLAGITCEPDPARGDKVVRAEPFASQWEAGNVDVLIAEWTEQYLDEMEGFPEQPFKDSVDASSGAFNKLSASASDVEPVTANEGETYLGEVPSGAFRSYGGIDDAEG